MKVYDFRKVKQLNFPYYIIDYDFERDNQSRRAWYHAVKPLLPGKISSHCTTMSVIRIDDPKVALAVYKLILQFGGKACLRSAMTIDSNVGA